MKNHETHEFPRKGEKQGCLASQTGGVFANPLASELADGFSKTPPHSLRECPALALDAGRWTLASLF
jgi:hypothetical protein